MTRPPLPPFTFETATQKVRAAEDGYMARRIASINDLAISEADRRFRWDLGVRPEGHAGLEDLGL